MAKQVTVVIPTVDRPALLTQAVASVLAQDWPDLHVIVVFDGAPARSIIDDDRVSVTSTGHERLGGGAARNLGMSMADGTHVAFLDDDDLWEPSRVSRAMAAADAAPVVVSWSRYLGRPATPGRSLAGDVSATILDSFTPSLGAVLVDRNALVDFDPRWRAVEDVEWWIRMAAEAPVITVPHADHLVRRHDGPRFGNGNAERIGENLALIEHHERYFSTHPGATAFRLRRAAAYTERCADYRQSRGLLRRSIRTSPSLGAARDYLRIGFR